MMSNFERFGEKIKNVFILPFDMCIGFTHDDKLPAIIMLVSFGNETDLCRSKCRLIQERAEVRLSVMKMWFHLSQKSACDKLMRSPKQSVNIVK